MKNDISSAEIKHAAAVLRNGGIAVFPTESSYGLGGKCTDPAFIDRIMQLKGRKDPKFTLIASSLEQVQQFFHLTKQTVTIAQQYWPGALSVVVDDQFSVRVPAVLALQQLVEQVGTPLIATSANKSGKASIFSLEEAQTELGKENVDVWLDGGTLPVRKPSTIVDARGNHPMIIRQGAVEFAYNE